MENNRIKEIAQMLARKKILDTKIPSPQTPAFNKWVEEAAQEFGLSCEEFAEYVQITLREAVEEVTTALEKFKVKRKSYGFLP